MLTYKARGRGVEKSCQKTCGTVNSTESANVLYLPCKALSINELIIKYMS